MTDLKDKLRFTQRSPLSGERETYRFWKRAICDAGKQRCWSAIAPQLEQKISKWRPGSWKAQIPVDVNAINSAKLQLLQWLSLPEPACTENLTAFDILDEKPGMFPFRRTFEVILVRGLYDGMNSKSGFEKSLLLFVDYLSEPGRRTFLKALNGSDLETQDVG